MSDSFNPPNSIWPNGMKVDEEGYAVFYPLGTNKTNISTITWPEGNKLVSPFVYDKNNKLVGFADTKALEIDNNDTTININYTHFDADLDSIMENTLTINAPENATVNVKYGAVDKVLTEKIEKVLGKGNCKVSYDKDTNKAIVAIAFDTTEAQIAEVQSLLDRILPRNLVTEIEPFPCDFTRVEYLEGTKNQYIDTGIVKHGNFTVDLTYVQQEVNRVSMCGYRYTHEGVAYGNTVGVDKLNFPGQLRITSTDDVVLFPRPSNFDYTAKNTIVYTTGQNNVLLNDVSCKLGLVSNYKYDITNALNKTIHLFAYNGWSKEGYLKIYNFSLYEKGKSEDVKFIPALDPTGTPCMFDTVTRTPFYNFGAGDFLYPGAVQAIQTLDLDLDVKSYAKLTEHGVRRLYHIPKGCSMTKDEYAVANGFKELVEPPMPEEGYWMPQWRETDTQLICDWIETEPPTEEAETFNN